MSCLHCWSAPVPLDICQKFEVRDWRNGLALLQSVAPSEWSDIEIILQKFELKRSFFSKPGGNKSPVASAIDSGLYELGWLEKKFDTKIVVDGAEYDSPTHSIDCFKGRVGLEVEWNNKDPFFDRDLNNFRLIYELRVMDVGVLITRDTSLTNLLRSVGRANSTYGAATTHSEKLWPKLIGGGAGGCPVVVFAIRSGSYIDDRAP